MRRRTRARECALKVLYAMDIKKEGCKRVLADFWSRDQAPEKQVKEFAEILVKGISKNISDINQMIAGYATNWNIKRMATIDRNILRMATYEILFMEDVPAKVSINEAVDLAKKFGDKDSGKFVNGILDKICKTQAKDKLIRNRK